MSYLGSEYRPGDEWHTEYDEKETSGWVTDWNH
jgi:hypothetical protein